MTIRARVTVALKPSDCVWLAIGGLVVTHNVVAAVRGGEQLSEAVNRYRKRYPMLTTGVIVVTAAHLRRVLPAWGDPWLWLFGAVATINKVRAPDAETRVSL